MPDGDLTLKQLRVFTAAVRHGGISRAASALGLPQPAISRLISRVEETAGTRLLERTGSGIKPTEAGQRFLDNATQVIRFHDLALSDAAETSGYVTGEARIAGPESIGDMIFATLVKQYRTTHPRATIRTIAAQSAAIPTLLDTGMVDIGIIADTHPAPTGLSEHLFDEDFYLVGPSQAKELDRDTISLSEVAELPLVLNAMPGGFRTVIDSAFSRHGLNPDVRVEIDANGPLLELILGGEGFSILPYGMIAKREGKERFAAAKVVNPTLSRKLSLVTARGRPLTPAGREAIRLIKNSINMHSEEARWKLT